MKTITIHGRTIGAGNPCFIVAEAGVNHNGDPALARLLVDAAVQAKADAVKFQTFHAEALVTTSAPKANYQAEATGKEESQFEMLRKLELTEEAHRDLFSYCHNKGIIFLSTPFDEASADFLAALGVEAFKIGSGEITNLFFLSHVARKGRPLILSTGMSDLAEVGAAVDTVRFSKCRDLALLHCTSNYPADPSAANLRAMRTLEEAFSVPIGFSDHTCGIEVAIGAAALGACIIEKHLTLDRAMQGPDHKASLSPDEFAALVYAVRNVEMALGDGQKKPAISEACIAAVARRSLVAAHDIAPGTRLSPADIVVRRPGTGLPPAMLNKVLGRTTKLSIPAGTLLSLDALA